MTGCPVDSRGLMGCTFTLCSPASLPPCFPARQRCPPPAPLALACPPLSLLLPQAGEVSEGHPALCSLSFAEMWRVPCSSGPLFSPTSTSSPPVTATGGEGAWGLPGLLPPTREMEEEGLSPWHWVWGPDTRGLQEPLCPQEDLVPPPGSVGHPPGDPAARAPPGGWPR